VERGGRRRLTAQRKEASKQGKGGSKESLKGGGETSPIRAGASRFGESVSLMGKGNCGKNGGKAGDVKKKKKLPAKMLY